MDAHIECVWKLTIFVDEFHRRAGDEGAYAGNLCVALSSEQIRKPRKNGMDPLIVIFQGYIGSGWQ